MNELAYLGFLITQSGWIDAEVYRQLAKALCALREAMLMDRTLSLSIKEIV